jgi:hypothetical protein
MTIKPPGTSLQQGTAAAEAGVTMTQCGSKDSCRR